MKFSILTSFIFYTITLASYQCRSNREDKTITVFCAAGLVDVIEELSDSFTMNSAIQVKINMASSGSLARQLEQGNRTDIYISANTHWANYCDSLGIFSERKELYQNKLVFVCPQTINFDSINFSSSKIPEFLGRLSIGDPEYVPAGQYAKEALISLGWWNDLQKRMLPAKDVRSALMPVELGECELGIVYYSDALASKKVKILGTIPESSHTPIIFQALLSKTATHQAKEFYKMLNSNNFEKTWMKYGLTSISMVK
jgi:molybdate transport system substrate-binding protein